MTNRDTMRSALQQHTVPLLICRGFTGKYPHFRRAREGCIELLSFQTNKWGGSFTVEVSAAFPKAEDTNYSLYGSMTEKTLNVSATNQRYRLPGMFDGWFYYTDVYRKRTLLFGSVYHNVSERDAGSFVPPKGYRLVQRFDAETAARICEEVNRQLDRAFAWLTSFCGR